MSHNFKVSGVLLSEERLNLTVGGDSHFVGDVFLSEKQITFSSAVPFGLVPDIAHLIVAIVSILSKVVFLSQASEFALVLELVPFLLVEKTLIVGSGSEVLILSLLLVLLVSKVSEVDIGFLVLDVGLMYS